MLVLFRGLTAMSMVLLARWPLAVNKTKKMLNGGTFHGSNAAGTHGKSAGRVLRKPWYLEFSRCPAWATNA